MRAVPSHTTPLLDPDTVQPHHHAATPPAVPYVLPIPSACQEWARHACRDFVPTERQRRIIEAVQAALDAKLFYTDDVDKFCAQRLHVTTAQAHVSADKVQGGEFGMDCYFARRYLDSRRQFEAEDAAHQRLAPRVGMHLGTLMFNDFKRNTGMIVEELLAGGRLKLRGKRGAYVVTLECTALQIALAIDRAAERGMRKDRFNHPTMI
jgi:hypothetical protein